MSCVETLAAFEGVVGYVPETDCGITPDISPGTEYNDVSGTKHLFAFAPVVESIEPEFNTNQIKKRGIGNRTHVCNQHGRFDTTISYSFYPTDFAFVPFALGAATGTTDHLPSMSIERAWKRTSPNPFEHRELFNGVKVNTWTVEASIDDHVKFSGDMMALFMQPGTSKSYVGNQTVDVGEDPFPDVSPCDMFHFYEGDIYITREIIDEVHSGDTTAVLSATTFVPINFTLSELDPLDAVPADVTVTVDGVPDTIVSVVGDIITITTVLTGAEVVLVDYHHREQLTNVSEYSFEVDNGLRANTGLRDGLAIPYEIVKTMNDISGSFTTNFQDLKQYNQNLADEYFNLYIEIGSTKLFIHQLAKWEPNVVPPMAEDDLVEEALTWTAQDLVTKDTPAGW